MCFGTDLTECPEMVCVSSLHLGSAANCYLHISLLCLGLSVHTVSYSSVSIFRQQFYKIRMNSWDTTTFKDDPVLKDYLPRLFCGAGGSL